VGRDPAYTAPVLAKLKKKGSPPVTTDFKRIRSEEMQEELYVAE
tara:strand:- start:55 stop:186 length:132 start_codon:yes stop_codon:yes gene_type:complete